MAWIKRNLYFFIGSIVAVALMVAGAFYLFSQISDEGRVANDISQQFAELERLNTLNPHPGGGTIDNIKAAKAQATAVRAYVAKARGFFQRITPIPDPAAGKIGNSDFATALRLTVTQLHHEAEQQSVLLADTNYYFTFEAQKRIFNFDPASLDKLAMQLGEVKAISEILFDAKVNSLDSIRREIVSTDDKNQSDYLTQKTVSTPLADLTPYEVKFRCFSTELASVMSSLASSPYGFIIKTINVEPTAVGPEEALEGAVPGATTPMVAPPVRYGDGGGRRGGRNGYIPPPAMVPSVAPVAAPKPGSFLNEKPFTVTMMIQVVKAKATTTVK